MIPPWIWFVQKAFIYHFYDNLDVVIACIEHKVSQAFRAIEAALVKHDNNMKDYSLVVDWSP